MPILNPRYPHTKVWRPKGTRYGWAQGTVLPEDDFATECGFVIHSALINFCDEFGPPDLERVVVEIIGVTAKIDVMVYELPEDE